MFPSDKRVIDLPVWLRYPLLYCFTLPFRPRRSAKAYQAIWTTEGSPLITKSRHLRLALQARMGEQYQVEVGMRAKEQWLELGGETFTLIECMNDSEQWIDAIKAIVDQS